MKSGRLSVERIAIVVLSIAVVSLLVYNIFFNKPVVDDKYTKKLQEIDSLTQVINKLEQQHLIQDSIIATYQVKVDSLDTEIVKSKDKIEQIKKEYGKKIKAIGNYTPTELDGFFTDRYK